MIDYEKLKIIEDLCKAYKNKIVIWHIFGKTEKGLKTQFDVIVNDEEPTEHNSYEEVIQRLKLLVSNSPKYNIGQKVWYIEDYEKMSVNSFIIEKIDVQDYVDQIIIEYDGMKEKYLFDTLESLIQSQKDKWNNLLLLNPDKI